MAFLNTKTIAAGVGDILAVDGGLTATPKVVADGDGTASKLFLATDSVLISGSGTKLNFHDDGGEYISGDGTDLKLVSGADILLTPTGNVGIGTTAPNIGNLEVAATEPFTAGKSDTAGHAIHINNDAISAGSGQYGGAISWSQHDYPLETVCAIVSKQNSADIDEHGLSFFTHGSTDTDASVERMVIAGSGNIGIGTAIPTYPLEVYRDNVRADIKCHAINLVDTEKATFTAAGTAASGTVRYAAMGVYYNSSAVVNDETTAYIRLDANDGVASFYWPDGNNLLKFTTTEGNIGTNDGVATTGTFSDERLKNISSDPFPYGLSEINQLTPIKYAFKKGDTSDKLGFGAQTVKPILPETVINTKECLDGYTRDLYTADDSEVISGEEEVGMEKGTETPNSSETDKLAMEYMQIIPVLVKAVQELSAKVTALENA